MLSRSVDDGNRPGRAKRSPRNATKPPGYCPRPAISSSGVSHVTVSIAPPLFATVRFVPKLSIEEVDDLAIHHHMHRIAIKALRISGSLTRHDSQGPGE